MAGSLGGALRSKQILVVCGSGGVGKTSVSAALALAAGRERKTIVVTVDPARRLASALGLHEGLAHAEKEVALPDGGSMYAAMLDMKTAWDEMVERYAPNAETARSIKTNRIYQTLSEHFVGSYGYMAMERLADLHGQGSYELIVIDTPPTRHALDFLDAPKRMTDFVGGSLLRWFAKPYAVAGKAGLRAFNFTASPFLRIADRVLGSQVLEDLSRFVLDFNTLYDDFKVRAANVLDLLHDRRTGFVIVTTLEPPSLREAGFFIDRLSDERMPLAGAVANKVFPPGLSSPDARATLRALDDADLATVAGDAGVQQAALEEARTALRTLADLGSQDAERIRDLERRCRVPVTAVPLFTEDVHDLPSLGRLASYLLGSEGGDTSPDAPARG